MTDESEIQRTRVQNNCLHQFFRELSEALNDGGYSVQQVITLPISHTTENIKVNIGHTFMRALYPELERKDGTYSTTDLSTKQIQFLYENINNAMSVGFGISLDWPDRFNGGKCK
jgi:cyclopropane fatty-acyl-phospholipid synthase-like methyltransferase